jgi:hypothetical protein
MSSFSRHKAHGSDDIGASAVRPAVVIAFDIRRLSQNTDFRPYAAATRLCSERPTGVQEITIASQDPCQCTLQFRSGVDQNWRSHSTSCVRHATDMLFYVSMGRLSVSRAVGALL